MVGAVDALDAMYQILYTANMFLSPREAAALSHAVTEFGLQYQRLREISRRSGILGFAVTPKVHKYQHLPRIAESINPRFCQNYAEEATMGTVSATWAGSATGQYMANVQEVVLAKRLVALLLRVECGL